MKKAEIYIDNTFCGVLTEDSEGGEIFDVGYVPAYKQTDRAQIQGFIFTTVDCGEQLLFRSASGCPTLLGDCAILLDNRQF